MKLRLFSIHMLRNKAGACFVAALLFLLTFLNIQSAFAQEPGDPYADRVVNFSPGDPANPELGNPETVLGPPDFNADALSGFLNLGVGGSVTLEFMDNRPMDGPGPDIHLYGDPANDERWIVEVSQDGEIFVSFDDRPEVTDLDLADVGLSEARFIRLTDDGDPGRGISPGAELDAVEALNLFGRPEAQQLYLRAVEPPEGRPGEELELTLWGSGFAQFEGAEKVQVTIGGFEIWDVRIASNQAIRLRAFIPEDAPPGPRSIEVRFIFGPNEEFAAGLEDGFFVSVPSRPGFPTTTVIVVVIIVTVGILGRRFFRGHRIPDEKTPEKPVQPQAKIDFIVKADPGTQSVKQAERSPKMDIDLRFEIEVDQGEQTIEMAGNSIISRE